MLISQSKIHGLVALCFKLLFLLKMLLIYSNVIYMRARERANLKVGFHDY